MSRKETLMSLREDIIETYLLEDVLPIQVYEQFVDGIDLGLFDNNRGTFLKFVEDVTFDALYASIVIQKNKDLF